MTDGERIIIIPRANPINALATSTCTNVSIRHWATSPQPNSRASGEALKSLWLRSLRTGQKLSGFRRALDTIASRILLPSVTTSYVLETPSEKVRANRRSYDGKHVRLGRDQDKRY